MEVNINKLIGLGLTIREYMILYLMYNEMDDIIASYSNNVEPIEYDILDSLVERGYLTDLEFDDSVSEIIDNYGLTDKFKTEVLNIPVVSNSISFDEAFNQLRDHFPTKVYKVGGGIRRLQSDIDRCKKLYKNIILKSGEVDIDKHKLILQCIDFEKKERIKSKDEEFWLLLPTYLQQKRWEIYQDDVQTLLAKNGTLENTSEDYIEDRL